VQNNIFIPIEINPGKKQYINPHHIVRLYDKEVEEDNNTLYFCVIELQNGVTLSTFEPAVSIIEKILTFNGQAKDTNFNSK